MRDGDCWWKRHCNDVDHSCLNCGQCGSGNARQCTLQKPKMTVTVDWLSTPPLNKHLLPTSSPNSPSPFKLKKRPLDQRPEHGVILKRKVEVERVARYTVLEQQDGVVNLIASDGAEYRLILRGDWAELQLETGMQINVIRTNLELMQSEFTSSFSPGGMVTISESNPELQADSNEIVVDNNQGFVVVDPDRLLSATTVSDCFACPRKTILNQKISNYGYTWPLLKGTLLHSLLQAKTDLDVEIYKLMEKSWDNMYVLDLNEQQLVDKLAQEIKLIKEWYSRNPGLEVIDIEQKIWSFDYGLKGNVDMTVKQGNLLIPLELKTGKSHYSHRAQTSLYAMMMSNFNTQKLDKGILVYLNNVETIQVGTNIAEQRGLLMGRNRLVTDRMPPMIENISLCKNCFAKRECAIYAKAMEPEKEYTPETTELINSFTSELTDAQLQFLRYWEQLISVEENSKISVKRESLNNLHLDNLESLNSNDSKFCFQLSFVGNKSWFEKSMLDSNLAIGDPILVSLQQERNPIALGYISNITNNGISVYTDKEIKMKTDSMVPIVYKITSDRYSNNLGMIRGALYSLFTSENTLRDFIVDLKKPEFSPVSEAMINPILGVLNTDQQKAILNALSSHKYSLILGMPGTGKTTTM